MLSCLLCAMQCMCVPQTCDVPGERPAQNATPQRKPRSIRIPVSVPGLADCIFEQNCATDTGYTHVYVSFYDSMKTFREFQLNGKMLMHLPEEKKQANSDMLFVFV